jgi:hypothetical protein
MLFIYSLFFFLVGYTFYFVKLITIKVEENVLVILYYGKRANNKILKLNEGREKCISSLILFLIFLSRCVFITIQIIIYIWMTNRKMTNKRVRFSSF